MSVKKNGRTPVYPSKTGMNLAMRDRKTKANPVFVVVSVILVAAIAVLFSQFAVVRPMAQVMQAKRTAQEAEQQLAMLEEHNADYEEIRHQYGVYANRGFTDDELARVDRLDVLELVENELMRAATVRSLAVTGNEVSTTLSDISLNRLSTLYLDLTENALVDSVTVTAVDGQGSVSDDANTTASIIIKLTTKGADGE
ncbi:MAG: hypothetical protein PHD67_05910 [Oscillospiraceae bacterium]|nr:hypothetical protein [Oscillospiraceae bacterium]